MTDKPRHVLIGGAWRESSATQTFASMNPETGQPLGTYPVSPWSELEQALEAGAGAFESMFEIQPESVAAFLELFAERIEKNRDELVETAHAETALPAKPRLADVELPRTTNQLRLAADAARTRAWKHPVLSPEADIASLYEAIPGVICVFGPNNFPFAFNSVAGGDFAAAVATGHPTIAKGNPGHPETTRILAREAHIAIGDTGLPASFVQLIYRIGHSDGKLLVADPRVAATAYTGSRASGLVLKAAAEQVGNQIYLEMSSVNPVVVLPGSWRERGDELAAELVGSMLMGTGQFCTSPGLIFMAKGREVEGLRDALKHHLEEGPVGTLLGEGVREGLELTKAAWSAAGARVVAEAAANVVSDCSFPNAMMEVTGKQFLGNPDVLQAEAFGNLSLLVVCADRDELHDCLRLLEGNLTGSIYSAGDGSDDGEYETVSRILRSRAGRLLNDKVPTGVAVVPAMNHGGPYPSTGHPGFTAVGIPASLSRFAMLQCYDNVRDDRLPPELQADNPLGLIRYVHGEWTVAPIA